jgi:hypothetical protein
MKSKFYKNNTPFNIENIESNVDYVPCSLKNRDKVVGLHLCTLKTPPKGAVMSERGDVDCAFTTQSMRNGVNVKRCKITKKKYGGMNSRAQGLLAPLGSLAKVSRPRTSQKKGSMTKGSQKKGSMPRGSLAQASAPQASAPQASAPQASAPQGSAPQGSLVQESKEQVSAPQIARIKPSFEDEFKNYCINNFIGSDLYDEYTRVLPDIYKDKDDIKKQNTMYLLIFIISMLNVILKDKCKIITKGGLAVLFAVSAHEEYSTKDIDLLIQPLDGNDGVFHAQFIANMIMWIFEDIDGRFNKLSLLDESAREIKEKQLLKISMIDGDGDGHGHGHGHGRSKFTAVIDINIHLPDDNRFYLPLVTHHINTYNEDGFGPAFFHRKTPVLFFVSKEALIFDRMLHLLKYNHLISNISYIESIAMDVIQKYPDRSSLDEALSMMGLARKLNPAKKDEVRDKIYELSTQKSKTHKGDPNKIYLASIKKSLNALILENIASHSKKSRSQTRSPIPHKSKEDVFDHFINESIKKYNSLTPADINIHLTSEQRDKLKNYILSS